MRLIRFLTAIQFLLTSWTRWSYGIIVTTYKLAFLLWFDNRGVNLKYTTIINSDQKVKYFVEFKLTHDVWHFNISPFYFEKSISDIHFHSLGLVFLTLWCFQIFSCSDIKKYFILLMQTNNFHFLCFCVWLFDVIYFWGHFETLLSPTAERLTHMN